ncbi:MAG: hypothetical protein H6627_13175 [Calditrichae bacterium]|nr:hypothetical protein [Calditrichia bacterium]
MARFQIEQVDPLRERENIYNFWDAYLPGTRKGRLDWLLNGNPAGPIDWFFAYDMKSGEIAGMISVIPRLFTNNFKQIRAGMMGDYMISKKYRVFGPAFQLPNHIVSNFNSLGYDFLYTVPIPSITKLIKGFGFKDKGTLIHLAKMLHSRYYLKNYVSGFVLKTGSILVDLFLYIISAENYHKGSINCSKLETFDAEYQLFWEKLRLKRSGFFGECSSEYMNWRYLKNPHYTFKILKLTSKIDDKILGIIIYMQSQNKIEIFEMLFLDEDKNNLLANFLKCIRKEKVDSIFLRILETNPLVKNFKHFGFINMKDNAYPVFNGSEDLLPEPMYFNFTEKML